MVVMTSVVNVIISRGLKNVMSRGGGTGEAGASPNFRGLLKGNFNDFGKKKGKTFRASSPKNLFPPLLVDY